MSNEFLVASRFAVSGIAVGALAGSVTDYVGFQVLSAINLQQPPAPQLGGAIGRALASVVAGALIAGAGVLAGEKIMNAINPGLEDPLFRTFYYWSALNGSTMFTGSARTARNLIGMLLNPGPQFPPQPPAQAAVKPGVSTPAKSCGVGSCK